VGEDPEVPAAPPDGEPAPADGALPRSALDGVGQRPFGVYVHVPFCRTRCGYCDFNTYTAAELGGAGSRSAWAHAAVAEVALARRVLGEATVAATSVFFGGGTPTLLPPEDLGRVLAAIRDQLGLREGAEVTTEANPDGVDGRRLGGLREQGVTRVSYGMQSAVPHVLATLDRTHDPARVPQVVAAARAAGFTGVSLDLIYGTPGESIDDWRRSLDAALACEPDHVSAYALVVEPGTRLAAQVRRGEVAPTDEDDLAEKYELADDVLTAAGLAWYELSNWAREPGQRCRHNELYWTGGDWWGIGPGAHSHVGGARWWNRRHPTAWAERLAAGCSPAAAREVLAAEDRRVERVMLELRLRAGLDLDVLDSPGRVAAAAAVADGLADPAALARGRLVLTRRGRLLADAVVRSLLR
jgi:oxygen-independent coproporphyrinogen-3 oxidase